MSLGNILSIKNLNVQYKPSHLVFPILKDLSFEVPKGKVLGVTGTSGSGKSMTALAIMGLTKFYDGLTLNGEIFFDGDNLLNCTDEEWNHLRGNRISLIAQQPDSALNPMRKVGDQMMESISVHQSNISKSDLHKLVQGLLQDVGFTDVERIFRSYPHELSGGQLQRICLAMAIANRPEIIIADEPTSSLDKDIADEVINLLLKAKSTYQMTLIFISHDLNLIKRISDYIMLLHEGEVVDFIPMESSNKFEWQEYSKLYLNAGLPQVREPQKLIDADNCLVVEGLSMDIYRSSWVFWRKSTPISVLADINLKIPRGTMLGICGASGSGKSTLAKIISGILSPTSGKLSLDGREITPQILGEDLVLRRKIQLILQDALSSMNPKMQIGEQWNEIIYHHGLAVSKDEANKIIENLLDEFSLHATILDKYPTQISGGQRQRVALARTLLVEPELVIFDEALSAVDVFNQQNIIKLIINSQAKRNFTGIFISHDPVLINAICHEFIVLENGRIIDRKFTS